MGFLVRRCNICGIGGGGVIYFGWWFKVTSGCVGCHCVLDGNSRG